jgi:hypothetical protein
MKKGVLILALVCVATFVLGSATAQATWYTCKVAGIVPWSSGDTRIQLDPGTGETRFAERARVNIPAAAVGGNKMVAALLTAISLGYEVTVECTNAPSWGTIQDITGVNLQVIP